MHIYVCIYTYRFIYICNICLILYLRVLCMSLIVSIVINNCSFLFPLHTVSFSPFPYPFPLPLSDFFLLRWLPVCCLSEVGSFCTLFSSTNLFSWRSTTMLYTESAAQLWHSFSNWYIYFLLLSYMYKNHNIYICTYICMYIYYLLL